MKKIILVGNWSWEHCEKAFSDNLKNFKFKVIPFVINNKHQSKLQQLIPVEILNKNLQKKLIKEAIKEKPEFIFLWNATHITPKTVKTLKNKGIKIITYSNDDPYKRDNKPLAQLFLWRNFLRYIKYSDFHFVYRPANILESKKYTQSSPNLLLPYFIPESFSNIELTVADKEKYACDIVFIGHYENDYRSRYLESIYDLGYCLKIFGTGWEKSNKKIREKFGNIERLNQLDYFKSLNASKICLAFLSKFNRDVYTRRCFEIPGSGNLLLCERTSYMQKLFKEDHEAVFFDSEEEMLKKIEWLLSDPSLVSKIAAAGQKRSIRDGYDIRSRVSYFVDLISENSDESL